nr:hypothetical protein HK105_001985 [Polyrhizophydium stewartii]
MNAQSPMSLPPINGSIPSNLAPTSSMLQPDQPTPPTPPQTTSPAGGAKQPSPPLQQYAAQQPLQASQVAPPPGSRPPSLQPATPPSDRDASKYKTPEMQDLLALRNGRIATFVDDETKYAANLSHLVQFLELLIRKRRRRSNRIVKSIGESGAQMDPSEKRLSATFSSSLKQQANESDAAYKFRLDGEIEELTVLHSIVSSIFSLHLAGLKELRAAVDSSITPSGDESPILIGDLLLSFAEQMHKLYARFAVVALSNMSKVRTEIAQNGDLEHDSFLEMVASRFVALSDEDSAKVTKEASSAPFEWFLRRPILRLASYNSCMQYMTARRDKRYLPSMETDNRKILVASVKLGCTARAISETLALPLS